MASEPRVPRTMRAVGCAAPSAGQPLQQLVDLELPVPDPGPRDVLVRVRALAVNPVELRLRVARWRDGQPARVLGWDAAGHVVAVGAEVRDLKAGDEVLYAGSVTRPGSQAQFQCVDERLVGRKPAGLSFTEAASLPAAGLTAAEMLFERMAFEPATAAGRRLLVVGGAGGVASLAIQLAKHCLGLEVVATSSRPESAAWVRRMGADAVVDHGLPLEPQWRALGLGAIDAAFSMRTTPALWASLVALAKPRAALGFVDEPGALDMDLLRGKSLTVHAHGLFTRSLHQTDDMGRQGEWLTQLAQWRAQGRLTSVVGQLLGPVCAASILRAHQALASGRTCGKLVLGEFSDD